MIGGAETAATVDVDTSMILSAISARVSRVVMESADAKTILTFDGRRYRKSSHRNELSVMVP